jgi:hypothetical protein
MEKIKLDSFYQYAQAANTTLKRKATKKDDAGHYGLGVATEYFELIKAIDKKDKINFLEELGDYMWYLGNHTLDVFNPKHEIFNELNTIWFHPQYLGLNQEDSIKALTDYFEVYTDLCKKAFAYRKYVQDYPTQIGHLIKEISKVSVNILLLNNDVPKECLERNINKLYARYKGKFNTFLAMNRNLLVEHEILSEGVTL